MPKFAFTAYNSNGKEVSEYVEAENLGQAKYFAEVRGYTAIRFFDSDLTQQTRGQFPDYMNDAYDRQPASKRTKVPKDTRLPRLLFDTVLHVLVLWGVVTAIFMLDGAWPSKLTYLTTFVTALYIRLPVLLFDRLYQSHAWSRNRSLRFWAGLTKAFNVIAFVKIPPFEIEKYLAAAEAREGRLDLALARLERGRNIKGVTEMVFETALASVYGNARDFVSYSRLLERRCRAKDAPVELFIDHAMTLAWRHKETKIARQYANAAVERPMGLLAEMYVPLCYGVIEFEAGAFDRAEFYFAEAMKVREPYKKNKVLEGAGMILSAFAALTFAKLGRHEEGRKLWEKARPFLKAIDERDLIERGREWYD